MKLVVQRVKYASCKVDNEITGKIDNGFLLFVGFKNDDTIDDMNKVLKKVVGLRIFSDNDDKMNLSLKDVKGKILLISQFTLYADSKHGNRPSFTNAMNYKDAERFFDTFLVKLRQEGIECECGVFGADMKIELLNDGPVTILLDSNEL